MAVLPLVLPTSAVLNLSAEATPAGAAWRLLVCSYAEQVRICSKSRIVGKPEVIA